MPGLEEQAVLELNRTVGYLLREPRSLEDALKLLPYALMVEIYPRFRELAGGKVRELAHDVVLLAALQEACRSGVMPARECEVYTAELLAAVKSLARSLAEHVMVCCEGRMLVVDRLSAPPSVVEAGRRLAEQGYAVYIYDNDLFAAAKGDYIVAVKRVGPVYVIESPICRHAKECEKGYPTFTEAVVNAVRLLERIVSKAVA